MFQLHLQPGGFVIADFHPFQKQVFVLPGREAQVVAAFLQEAEGFIRNNADRAFFLMVSHYAVHTPLQGKPNKTAKYEERARMLGGTFVPLVCSVFGTLAPESVKLLSHGVGELSEEPSEKRCTTKMQRVALQVAILKATSLCLRARSR